MKNKIRSVIEESIRVKNEALERNIDIIERIAQVIISSYKNGGKLMLCGNGGSAADSQHVAAEFIGRFQKERSALAAIALTTDTSVLTSLSNDYSYDIVFARQVEALGKKGDVLIGISTSGKSANVVKAFEKAKALGVTAIAFSGRDGGPVARTADMAVIVPAQKTAHIQEAHSTILHALCEVVEDEFAK